MLNHATGVGEVSGATATPCGQTAATIVRGVLFVSTSTLSLPFPALLDATGRRVLSLHAGANDVSRLAPGVYFVRTGSGTSRVVVGR